MFYSFVGRSFAAVAFFSVHFLHYSYLASLTSRFDIWRNLISNFFYEHEKNFSFFSTFHSVFCLVQFVWRGFGNKLCLQSFWRVFSVVKYNNNGKKKVGEKLCVKRNKFASLAVGVFGMITILLTEKLPDAKYESLSCCSSFSNETLFSQYLYLHIFSSALLCFSFF